MPLADPERALLNFERLKTLPLIQSAAFYDEVTSTNDLALRAATDASLQTPALIVAARQTAGRGRGSNRWWSARGALTFSLILETGNGRWTAVRSPRISLACAISVCDAIEQIEPGIQCRVKWPNDVFVAGKKICGILVEIPTSGSAAPIRSASSSSEPRGPIGDMDSEDHQSDPRRIVLGIGLNVNNSWSTAPQALQSAGIALCDVSCRHYNLMDVLGHMLAALEARLDQLQTQDIELTSAWRSRCHLAGRHVQLTVGKRLVEGHCDGIDCDGSLLVLTAAGRERIVSGVVTRVR
jgi:BirA family biotin operon repressor/biotin-[acetyl-CoA-carboxylase] ligase